MNKVKRFFAIFFLITFVFLLFKYNYILNNSVINAVNLWLNKIFPSLFIMFVLNNIIINTNILKFLIEFINPLFNKIFHTTGYSSQAFILSLFSGTPSNAFIINEMLNKRLITLQDANKLISFTYFSNPLFLYNILNITFNKNITIKLIIIHYISNIFIGLIFRKKNNNLNNTLNVVNNKNNKLFLLLPNAIKKSINTLLMILGTITFYMIITNIITTIFNFNSITNILIKGIFEITQSLNILNILNIKNISKEIIAISIISFGGLSIHSQVISLINDTKISYKNFLIGRFLHVLISTFACWSYYLIC